MVPMIPGRSGKCFFSQYSSKAGVKLVRLWCLFGPTFMFTAIFSACCYKNMQSINGMLLKAFKGSSLYTVFWRLYILAVIFQTRLFPYVLDFQPTLSHKLFYVLGMQWCDFERYSNSLTHLGRVTHICVGKLTSISSNNGLSPGQREAIIWTNAGILLIGYLGTNLNF